MGEVPLQESSFIRGRTPLGEYNKQMLGPNGGPTEVPRSSETPNPLGSPYMYGPGHRPTVGS